MDPKIFSVEEANKFIPKLKQLLKTLRSLRNEIESKKVEMDLLEIVGTVARPGSTEEAMPKELEDLNRMAGDFNKRLEELEDIGCQVKDLDQGLVDFFSVREGHLIYLCWKEGEDSIQYWHTLDGGFKGRQPL